MNKEYKVILLKPGDLVDLIFSKKFSREVFVGKDKFIFFILDSYLYNSNEINALHSILKDICKDEPFKLLVADLGLTLNDNIDLDISVFCPQNSFEEFKKQKDLKKLEKDLATFIRREIDNYFPRECVAK